MNMVLKAPERLKNRYKIVYVYSVEGVAIYYWHHFILFLCESVNMCIAIFSPPI